MRCTKMYHNDANMCKYSYSTVGVLEVHYLKIPRNWNICIYILSDTLPLSLSLPLCRSLSPFGQQSTVLLIINYSCAWQLLLQLYLSPSMLYLYLSVLSAHAGNIQLSNTAFGINFQCYTKRKRLSLVTRERIEEKKGSLRASYLKELKFARGKLLSFSCACKSRPRIMQKRGYCLPRPSQTFLETWRGKARDTRRRQLARERREALRGRVPLKAIFKVPVAAGLPGFGTFK